MKAFRAEWKVLLSVAIVALAVRASVVVWAAGRFPPAGDGAYYVRLAERLANGEGYTWLWPDGAVTYAAHYPVGYPAMLAAGFAIVSRSDFVGMGLSALLGSAAAVLGADFIFQRGFGRRAALAAGLLLALHPALVPYTAAYMTEGIAGVLLLASGWALGRRPVLGWRGALLSGLLLGVATLVRPQSLLLAPVTGWICSAAELRDEQGAFYKKVARGLLPLLVAVAVCLPWTARNCYRMHECALVSVNSGWNLLIGARTSTGAWEPLEAPAACREVWDEAKKDRCFRDAAVSEILAHPSGWLGKIPQKLAVTFDYYGAAPWYLHASNPQAFDERDKRLLGGVETVFQRGLLLSMFLAFLRGRRGFARVVPALGAAFALSPAGWVAHLALAWELLRERELISRLAGTTLVVTAVTHAVFFGAGRYALLPLPYLMLAAGVIVFRRTSGQREIGWPPGGSRRRLPSSTFTT